MAFNGSGTYTFPGASSSFTAPVTGTTISSSAALSAFSDLALNGLTNVICKDGQTTVMANIPFGGFRLTSVGAGTAVSDASRVSQVQNASFTALTSVAGPTTITGVATPTPASYAEGQTFSFTAVGANGASPTLNVSSLGAALIFWHNATCTSSMWSAKDRIDVTYLSTSSATGFHVVGHSGFMPANLLRTKGSVATGAGDGNAIITAPSADGQYLESSASASGGVVWKTAPGITLGTEASTSGASMDFLSIPSGTKLIRIMFVGVSTNGTSDYIVQLGDSGGIENSGYLSTSSTLSTGVGSANFTAGFGVVSGPGAASIIHGTVTLTLENASNNTWTCASQLATSNNANTFLSTGSKPLSAVLDRVRITTAGGTDVFDAGVFNIQYQ
jgi:hypothetical protein